ncbi:FadR family transcriptional regulator [Candidimonas sp. SYP-B2681]|uniref:FadR/GntR family transcriptional regulator n=1 Tax=Candidimonas sp. SYP-B2681 TaxID=2497686 RepID=UPI000F89095F|nr:FadR/GntR family transcriptional regulator [Candidimonas sp. SYP-B2681]RTZ41481.1 FadR family transcriptional regulator [Candidimonas sp. SYP-B2681]
MPLSPDPRSRNLTQNVVAALSERIRRGEYHAGEKLPTESKFMESFGVSRTVIREAMSRLQAAGLVETRHGIGTFLREPKTERQLRIHNESILTMLDVMAILELRISLETEAAGLAALRRTEDHIQRLRGILNEFARHVQNKTGNAAVSDLAFHLMVATATGNRYFHDILEQLGSAIIPRTRIDSAALAEDDPHNYLSRIHLEHEDIYSAIVRKDPDAARAAMRTHLTNSRERLRQSQAVATRQDSESGLHL